MSSSSLPIVRRYDLRNVVGSSGGLNINDGDDDRYSPSSENVGSSSSEVDLPRQPLISPTKCRDRWNVVYLVFVVFGVAGTVPWNFFINAEKYWQYKLRDVDVNGSDVTDGVRSLSPPAPSVDPSRRNELQTKFESYLSISAMLPNVLGVLCCTLFNTWCSQHMRIVVPSVMVCVVLAATALFTSVNTDRWEKLFAFITLLSVAIMNGLTSFSQGSLFGIAGTMHPRFVRALMNGQAMGGILASLGMILTLLCGARATVAAFYYFIAAALLLLLSLIGYFVLLRTSFYGIHQQTQLDFSSMSAAQTTSVSQLKYSLPVILSETKVYTTSLVMVFIATLAVFPAVASLVISVNKESGSPWTNDYFLPVCGFLMFGMGDFSGRCISNWLRILPVRGVSIPIVCAVRLLYIPLFVLCNAHPRHHFPVLMRSDAAFVLLTATLGLSNGYLASHCMMHAPKQVEPQLQELAGIVMAFVMAFGIALGSILSTFLVTCL